MYYCFICLIEQDSILQMGMTDMFSDEPNFPRVSDSPVVVRKVIHVVDIEVNEAGTNVQARTGIFFYFVRQLKI